MSEGIHLGVRGRRPIPGHQGVGTIPSCGNFGCNRPKELAEFNAALASYCHFILPFQVLFGAA